VEYDEKKFIKNIKSLFQQNKIFEIHIFQINHYLGNEVSYSTTIDFFKSEEI
jgi:hypothetical protein